MHSFRRTTSDQLKEKLRRGELLLIVDLRERDDFAHEHIAGSINIPLDSFDAETFLRAHEQATTVYLICTSGTKAYLAASKFFDCGFFDVVVVAGGLLSWRVMGYPLVQKKSCSRNL